MQSIWDSAGQSSRCLHHIYLGQQGWNMRCEEIERHHLWSLIGSDFTFKRLAEDSRSSPLQTLIQPRTFENAEFVREQFSHTVWVSAIRTTSLVNGLSLFGFPWCLWAAFEMFQTFSYLTTETEKRTWDQFHCEFCCIEQQQQQTLFT